MKNILQKTSVLALAVCASLGLYAQRPTVSVSAVDVAPNDTATVSIFIDDNPTDSICSFEAKVYLPTGFTFVDGSVAKGERLLNSSKHRLTPVSAGSDSRGSYYKIGYYTNGDTPMTTDTKASMLTFKIVAPGQMELQSAFYLRDIAAGNGNDHNYTYTSSNAWDVTGYIYNSEVPRPSLAFESDSLTLKEGETSTIVLDATWGADYNIIAAQGKITLPEGLSFVENGDGDGISFEQSRFTDHEFMVNTTGNTVEWTAYSMSSATITPGSDSNPAFASFTVKAGKAFSGVVNATYLFSNSVGSTAAEGSDSLVVAVVAGDAPTVAFVADSIGLDEGADTTIAVKVAVPEGTKPSVKGAVTLPEGLSFAEGVEGTFAADSLAADTTFSFAVKADKAFEGVREITAVITSTSEFGTELAADTATAKVTIAENVAPVFAIAPDSITLKEGEEAVVAVTIVPNEAKLAKVAAAVTLPEGLTLVGEVPTEVAADAFTGDTVLTFTVKAGKATDEVRNIEVVVTPTSSLGTVFATDTLETQVTVVLPDAPTMAFAETDTLELESGETAAIVVNLTIPSGTELSEVAGTVILPSGMRFDDDALTSIEVENGTATANGRTGSFTITAPADGKALTINVKTTESFKSGAIKVVAKATTEAGSEIDLGSAERRVISKTATGINAVRAAMNSYDGPIYNLNGQRVGKDYKGVVIMNGKKYIAK